MPESTWLCLTGEEWTLICKALARIAAQDDGGELSKLAEKIAGARPPEMIVRVRGGFVEEIAHNPVTVTLYDYDTDGVDDDALLPDDSGKPCIVSEYPPTP